MPPVRHLSVAVGALLLALLAGEVYAQHAPNTYIFRDGRFYVNVNESILSGTGLEDPFARSWYDGQLGWNRSLPVTFSNIALGSRGEYYHFRPYVLPILSTPLYWAFGLAGALAFDLLCVVAVCACAFRFMRAYADPTAAALVAVALPFCTGISFHVYNYSVDILLLAFFTGALAALVEGRGLLAGALYALTLTIKPTSAIYVVPLALLFLERRDLRGLGRAVVGGGLVLLVAGAINTHMFGLPWLFGYNRMLTVVDGEPVIVSGADVFTTPFEVGWQRMWAGYFGLRVHWALYALGLPGALALLPRRPVYVLSAALGMGAAIAVFTRFDFEGDRFLLPGLALLSPAVARGLVIVPRAGRAALAALRLRVPAPGAATFAALFVVAAGLAALARGGALDPQLGGEGYVIGARVLAESGTLDLSGVPEVEARLGDESSVASLSRFGHLLPRTNALSVVVAAPAWRAGGATGLLLLHLLVAAVAAVAAVRLGQRIASPLLAAASVVGVTLLPPLEGFVLSGGPHLFAAAAGLWAGVLTLERRWLWAGVLAGLCAYLGDAPTLLVLAVPLLALREGRRDAGRAALGAAAVLCAWGLGQLLLLGRPFASPEEFVAVRLGAELGAFRVTAPSLSATVAAALASAGPLRALLPLALLAPPGLLVAARRDGRVCVLAAAILVSAPFAGVVPSGRAFAPLVAFGLALPLAALVSCAAAALGRRAALRTRAERARGALILACALLVLLGVAGAVRRAALAAEPFRAASPRAVREAEVHLDEVPCDFLAWENMSWECAHFDGGRLGRVGLALPERFTVAGAPSRWLLVPTGQRGRRVRRVRFDGVLATERLVLQWGLPDGFPPGAALVTRVQGEEVHRAVVGREEPTASVRVDTARFAGREVTLELEVAPSRPGPIQAVAVDAFFE